MIVDDQHVDVRTERDDGGGGWVYALRYEVIEDTSNTAQRSCAIRVPLTCSGCSAFGAGAPAT